MLEALFNYFYELFYLGDDIDGCLETFSIALGSNETAINNINLYQYLALLCSLISFVFIIVLCCLFVYKIIKLIGGLIR